VNTSHRDFNKYACVVPEKNSLKSEKLFSLCKNRYLKLTMYTIPFCVAVKQRQSEGSSAVLWLPILNS